MQQILNLIGRKHMHSENCPEKGVWSRMNPGLFVMGNHFSASGEGTCFWPSWECITPPFMCAEGPSPKRANHPSLTKMMLYCFHVVETKEWQCSSLFGINHCFENKENKILFTNPTLRGNFSDSGKGHKWWRLHNSVVFSTDSSTLVLTQKSFN